MSADTDLMELEQQDGAWYVLIAGMPPVEPPLQLAEGVTLRPLGDRLSIFDLAAVGAVGFREWAVLEPVAGGCCNEVVTARSAARKPGYDALNRAWLASALLALNGYTQFISVACSAYSWRKVAGHQRRASDLGERSTTESRADPRDDQPVSRLPEFSGGLLDYRLRLIQVADSRLGPPTEEDAVWVYDHFEDFNRLAAEDEAFRFALEAALDWRYATDARAAVARIWAGLEGLFGIKSELVFRFSSIAASLLEPRGRGRVSRFGSIKGLYAARSKIVHGSNADEEYIQRALDGSYTLLRELLLVVIERGKTLSRDEQLQALLG